MAYSSYFCHILVTNVTGLAQNKLFKNIFIRHNNQFQQTTSAQHPQSENYKSYTWEQLHSQSSVTHLYLVAP